MESSDRDAPYEVSAMKNVWVQESRSFAKWRAEWPMLRRREQGVALLARILELGHETEIWTFASSPKPDILVTYDGVMSLSLFDELPRATLWVFDANDQLARITTAKPCFDLEIDVPPSATLGTLADKGPWMHEWEDESEAP